MFRTSCLIAALAIVSACSTTRPPQGATLVAAEEVRSTETAFAKTMADRDLDAFARFISSDAIFFDGEKIQRGRAEILAAWKPLFADSMAPFSWSPDRVEVLASGDLAFSTGRVRFNGQVVGRFNSIWRLEAPHTWHIVFDKGE